MSDKTLSGLASKLDEKLLNAREKKENSLNDDSDDGLIIDSDEKSSLLDKLVEVPPETRNLSLFGAMIQLILSIVGSGCLAVPFAFSRVGIVTGIVCIFLIGLVGIVSSTILILCEETSYKDLAEKSMGQVGRRIIEFTIIIAIYANMVSYLIVIYNIIISIFSLFDPTVPSYVYLLTTLGWTLFVLLPMSVPCRLSLLVWTSFVGAITTYVLLVTSLSSVLSFVFSSPLPKRETSSRRRYTSCQWIIPLCFRFRSMCFWPPPSSPTLSCSSSTLALC